MKNTYQNIFAGILAEPAGMRIVWTGEGPMTASGGSFIRPEVNRKEVVSTVWSNDH